MHNPHEVIVCALVGPEAAEGCRRPVGSEEEEEEEEEKEEEGEAEEPGAPAIAGCWQGLLVLLPCACGDVCVRVHACAAPIPQRLAAGLQLPAPPRPPHRPDPTLLWPRHPLPSGFHPRAADPTWWLRLLWGSSVALTFGHDPSTMLAAVGN